MRRGFDGARTVSGDSDDHQPGSAYPPLSRCSSSSPTQQIQAFAKFYRLEVEIEYQGDPIELMNRLPTQEELATASGIKMLSHYIIRESADQVRVKQRDGCCVLYLHFEH